MIIVTEICNVHIALLDVDECVSGTDDCDDNAACVNEQGSFVCMCMDGYEGDGKICDGNAQLMLHICYYFICA